MQDKYKNILVIVTGMSVLSWIFNYTPLFQASLIVGLTTVFIPKIATSIDWIWLKFAHLLGWINAKILLSLIFFIFLLPIALISRLFTKDPLKLKGRNLKTLYSERNHLYTKDDLENIW